MPDEEAIISDIAELQGVDFAEPCAGS